jgi:hypothetical protein
MSIVLVGSTSGSVTLQEPAIAGTTVLDLPAVSGTILTTTSPKTGNVLQVVQGTTTTQVTTTSTSLVDTALTATITPTSASSKILVLVSQSLAVTNSTNGFNSIGLAIIRGSTNVFFSDRALATRAGLSGSSDVIVDALVAFNYLDSPSTTSATTYKTQFRVFDSANGNARAQEQLNTTSASSITLLEIAG